MVYARVPIAISSDFGHRILSEIGTPGSSVFGIVPISDVPYSDVHCNCGLSKQFWFKIF